MVLVLIFLAIIILIIIITLLVSISTLRIEVKNFEASNYNNVKNKKYEIKISLVIFNKIKWISFTLNNEKILKMYKSIDFNKINIKDIESNLKFEDLKELKKLQLKVSKLNMKLKVGTEDVIFTSYLIAILSSAIAIILPHIVSTNNKENYKYHLEPLYYNKNLYEIKLNCIIEVKMVHIIGIVYDFTKKRRSDFYGRASNRRNYGYSYE